MNKLLVSAMLLVGISVAHATPPGYPPTTIGNPVLGNCVEWVAGPQNPGVADSGTPCTPSIIITAYTNATTGYTAIMAMPPAAGATTLRGECTLTYADSSTSGTATFAIGASAAPTDLWVTANPTTGVYVAPTFTTITSTTTTAVTGALVTTTANANYQVYLSFTMAAAAVPSTLTVYAESNNVSYTVTVQAGSSCAWIP
jgi:hypothetical protein